MNRSLLPPVLKKFLRFLIPLSLAIFISEGTRLQAGTTQQQQSPVATKEKSLVLDTFPIAGLKFQLVVDECQNGECPIEVLLLKGDAVLDKARMPVAATSNKDMNREDVDEACGADPRLKAWSSGEEDGYVSTAARLIQLAPQQTGLLVDQCYGFQIIKRHHVLLLPEHGKLREIWSMEERQGPTWSATLVISAREGNGQDLVLFDGFLDPDPAMPQQLEIQRLHWNADLRQFKATLLPDSEQPLYAVLTASYATAAEARKASAATIDCTRGLWVISSAPYSGLPPGKVILGKFYLSSAEAEATAATIRKCSARLRPSVVKVSKHS